VLILTYVSGVGIGAFSRPWLLFRLDRSLLTLRAALRRALAIGSILGGMSAITLVVGGVVLRNVSTGLWLAALGFVVVGGLAGLGWVAGYRAYQLGSASSYQKRPANAVTFLEWCERHVFLTREGTTYIWFHRELENYFSVGDWGSALHAEPQDLLRASIEGYTPYDLKKILFDLRFWLEERPSRSHVSQEIVDLLKKKREAVLDALLR
jgi:hypothetical protein